MINIYLALCLCGLMSCVKNETLIENSTKNVNVAISNCDSIIYKLPDKTTDLILKMIEGKKVSFCSLVCNFKGNRYSFSFPYDDKYIYFKRDTILLNKTGTFLNLHGKYYPVIHATDDLFIDIPRDSLFAFNEFKSCIIAVNNCGEVVDGFAY